MTEAEQAAVTETHWRHSRYREDRAYLETFCIERLEQIAKERAAILAVQRDLGRLPAQTTVDADCPVCGAGSVRDLRPLYKLGRRLIHPGYGGPVIDPQHAAGGSFMSVAAVYECTTCQGFAVPPPPDGEDWPRWTPDSVADTSTALAAVLMRAFPQIEEVVYRTSYNEWHVRIGLDLWWCYVGPKDTVLQQLMLDRPRRRRTFRKRG